MVAATHKRANFMRSGPPSPAAGGVRGAVSTEGNPKSKMRKKVANKAAIELAGMEAKVYQALQRDKSINSLVDYQKSLGLESCVKWFHTATPFQIVEIERSGVSGALITDLSKRMELPASRLYEMLRIPAATASRKTSAGSVIDGRSGLAAIGVIKLLSIAQDIVEDSTAPEAEGFDTVKWLGQWIETPQPALGGRKPSDVLDTPTGVDIVAKVLGAIRSGAYL